MRISRDRIVSFLGRFRPAGAFAEELRYRVVLKYLGVVLATLSVEFLAAAAVALLFGESLFLYLILSAALFACGWALYRRVPEREVTVPETAAIASVSFLAASLAGAIPFVFLGSMPPLDAWFESMSGYTTTGFSLLDLKAAPLSLLFLRALSQWLGGMGFVVITISLLLVSGRSAITFLKEQAGEKVFPRISGQVRVVVATYAALSLLGVILLLAAGYGPFGAVCYALSGISTGGFAVHAGSVGEAAPGLGSIPAILVMGAGAANFILYYRCWKTNLTVRGVAAGFFKDPQVRTLIALTAVSGTLLALIMRGRGSILDGVFMAASAQTTTGYFTVAPEALPEAALLIIVFSMFIGGSMGSTAGGIKLFRLIEFMKGMAVFIRKQIFPEEVVFPGERPEESRPGEKTVAKEELLGIFYVIAVYILFIFAGTVVFAWYGHDALKSLFEVTSAAGTVGLSSGIVTPALAWPLKVILILLMWAGRLEFIPIIVWSWAIAAKPR